MGPGKKGTSPRHQRKHALALAACAAIHPFAWAQAPDDAADGAAPFQLGSVTIVGARGEDQVGASVTRADMQRFNRDQLGDALNLLAGVTLSTNARNEKTIAVRGFDARQVPLFIDGIPVYVPYDGYVDFDRFTTADLAAIEVAKGFSPVAYGPNALDAAINLVSRKPTGRLEADATWGAAAGGERQASLNVGTNQGLWYMQAGLAQLESDSFPLASGLVRTVSEDGGWRNNAQRKDSKLSFKVGLTPLRGDEYAISYYRQDGEKGQPPSTDRAVARYWKWPFWDQQRKPLFAAWYRACQQYAGRSVP